MGRDQERALQSEEAKISIHAPAWGATEFALVNRDYSAISIHAPAWGATLERKQEAALQSFQSTRPRGARLSGLTTG